MQRLRLSSGVSGGVGLDSSATEQRSWELLKNSINPNQTCLGVQPGTVDLVNRAGLFVGLLLFPLLLSI